MDSTFFSRCCSRERERKESGFCAPRDKNTQDDERHYWVHHHPGKGRGSLQTIQRPLSPFVQRTSHLKGVVVLVRPHPPREKEEKIVQVAVLRATCRSMMMTVLIKGFVSSTDDDDTRRRRKRMETQTALRRRVPPPQFSFLGFYKTLNFRPTLQGFGFFCLGEDETFVFTFCL